MFIKIGFSYEVLDVENCFVEGVYESQWVKITLPDKSSRIIGNIYRPNSAPRGNLSRAIEIHSSITYYQFKEQKTAQKMWHSYFERFQC